MAVIYSTTDTAEGTEAGDIIVTGANGTTSTIVNAGGGDDFIVLEQGPMFVDTFATNNSIATATSIEFAGNWSTAYSPMFADSNVPHTSVVGEGSGEFDYFAVTLAAGQTITLDVDGGRGLNETGTGVVDSWVVLRDALGAEVASNDDGGNNAQGGLGTTYNRDSFVTFTAATTGTYYIQVGKYASTGIIPIPVGGNYMLNVSVTGHAAAAPAPTIWDSTVNAGEGNDEIYGSYEYDTIRGDGGNDIIYGLAGQDTLTGGAGQDTVYAGEGNDRVYEGDGDDTVDGGSGLDTLSYALANAGVTVSLAVTTAQNTGGAGTDTITAFENLDGSTFDDTLTGDALGNRFNGGLGTNTINAGDGDDYITYGGGNDIVDGGIGNDTYYLFYASSAWTVDLRAGTGTSAVGGNTLSLGNVETFWGTAYDDVITGKVGTTIYAYEGNDYVHAVNGTPETIDGGNGIDTIDTSEFTDLEEPYTINLATGLTDYSENYVNFENLVSGDTADTVTGTDGANVIWTKGGGDTVSAGAGDDIVEAGTGVNVIDGGDNFDWASYEHAASGVTVSLDIMGPQATGIGTDTLTNIEGLIGSAQADSLTASALGSWFNGKGGNDTVFGGASDDRLIWEEGGGSDSFNGGGNSLEGDAISVETAASGWTINLNTGSATNGLGGSVALTSVEVAIGSAYDDTLIADNSGGSTLYGMGGNDTIFLGFSTPNTLYGGEGIDTLNTTNFNFSVAYTINLATALTSDDEIIAEFENVVSGSTIDTVTGTDVANRIETQGGDDIIDGGAGADTMIGGIGSDTYYVDHLLDNVVESNVTGFDIINSTVSYSLAGRAVERLVLTGVANANATGNGVANELYGNEGANTLDGKGGADYMAGGLGNDTYIVDDAGDVVFEGLTAGTDLVQTGLSYMLGDNVERLRLVGTGHVNGTGNGLENRLFGNDGNNRLDGLGGADILAGGLGNDTYVVDHAGDSITEAVGAGTDVVESSLTWTLGNNLERLRLTGTGNINATGNGLDNRLFGNDGANILNGLGGADEMQGGLGNDTYIVDSVGDVVTELAGAGTDVVESAVTWTLGANLERLRLTGTANINAIGNTLDNRLYGNDGNNIVNGGGGADQLYGRLGADTLVGGAGTDGFYFDTALGGGNIDKINDFNVADDTIFLENAIFAGLPVTGVLAPGAFVTGAAAGDANDRIIYNAGTGALLYDADGTGAGAAVQFATLAVGLALTNADFMIV